VACARCVAAARRSLRLPGELQRRGSTSGDSRRRMGLLPPSSGWHRPPNRQSAGPPDCCCWPSSGLCLCAW
jgi:hypothetical protein